jgi:ribose/xylose/arabinose/galactoside ABC-type transport system permease subunit/putative methionine-R-sulfoxide reductase with GAF domain
VISRFATPIVTRYAERYPYMQSLVRRNLLLIIFVALVGFFSLSSKHFASPGNLLFILMRTTPLGIVVAGQTLVIITGGIDLSVGSVAALTSIIAAKLMIGESGVTLPPVLAVAASLLVAAAIGWGHGWLITRKGLSPFIVTFSSWSVIKGLALVYSRGAPIPIPHGLFTWMWRIKPSSRFVPVLVLLLIFGAISYILRNTKLGRYIFAIGGNETVVRMSGVRVDYYKTQVYILSSLLAGLSGILLMTRIESGVYTLGEDYALVSVAAVIIGGASLRGGSGSAWGSLIGVLLLALVETGLSALDISSLWSSAVIGGLILLAALADVERQKAQETTPSIRMEHPVQSDSYLSQLMADLRSNIKQHLACEYIRLYVVDRETRDIIEQDMAKNGRMIIDQPEHLAKRVENTRQPVWIDDLSQEGDITQPIKPDLQSALAVPIIHADRVVGILELQSPYSSVFGETTAASLSEIARQIAAPLEDAWLLDSGWFLRHAREAFRHLWDEVYLSKCPLADWMYDYNKNTVRAHPTVRGREVQKLLLSAIETVREKKAGDYAPAKRRYQVLHETYAENLSVEEITKKLGVSRRQYFYDLKEALEFVVHLIINQEVASSDSL